LTKLKPLPMDDKSLKFTQITNLNGKSGIEAYAHWFAQQPLETQQEYIRLGLAPESREGDGSYTFEVKPDHKAYAYTEDLADIEQEQDTKRSYSEDEVQEVIRRVVMAMQLSEAPEVLFQARCILIAFGIGDPPSETELAKQRDCSRQFVSKKVKRIQQLFNLSPSQFMRSEAACKAYADAWLRNKTKRGKKHIKQKQHNSLELNTHPYPHTPPPTINKLKKSHNLIPPSPPPPLKESIIHKPSDAGSLDTTPRQNKNSFGANTHKPIK